MNHDIKRIDDRLFLEALKARAVGPRLDYKAFYSTFLGGLTTEPHHMIVPIDEHMVHRGDGVFEAIKFVDGAIYTLERHLDRLEISAENIGLKIPETKTSLMEVIKATVKASGLKTGLIRLFVGRGPGGFTTNPYETIGAQIYCAITKLGALPTEKYLNGVCVAKSAIGVKEGFFARTKTCNYLPNVLMKKEALDRGFDFMVSVDEHGNMAESSTENFALITEGAGGLSLVMPEFDRILRGVTAVRAMELAPSVGLRAENRRFNESDCLSARGAVMLGTTLDVLPVASFEGHRYGPVVEQVRALMDALKNDIAGGPLRTQF